MIVLTAPRPANLFLRTIYNANDEDLEVGFLHYSILPSCNIVNILHILINKALVK